jgi:CDP-glucose 4,6-dehydratase
VHSDFWAGRRVLLTGHTGFKGGWLALWLHRLGAEVTGFGGPPPTSPALFGLARVGEVLDDVRGDLRSAAAAEAVVKRAAPEVVLHLAAQPLVRRSWREPVETFAVNTLGTVHVLEAVRRHAPEAAVVVVTTDKCYADPDSGRRFTEDDRLGGKDPYSASKAAAELAWRPPARAT